MSVLWSQGGRCGAAASEFMTHSGSLFPGPSSRCGCRSKDPGSEALADIVPYLRCLWIFHHQWLLVELDPTASREGAAVNGAH